MNQQTPNMLHRLQFSAVAKRGESYAKAAWTRMKVIWQALRLKFAAKSHQQS